MPSLTFTSPGPLTATVHLTSPTTREVTVLDLGDGTVELELGDVEVGARLIGRPDVLHALIVDADTVLARLRGMR